MPAFPILPTNTTLNDKSKTLLKGLTDMCPHEAVIFSLRIVSKASRVLHIVSIIPLELNVTSKSIALPNQFIPNVKMYIIIVSVKLRPHVSVTFSLEIVNKAVIVFAHCIHDSIRTKCNSKGHCFAK